MIGAVLSQMVYMCSSISLSSRASNSLSVLVCELSILLSVSRDKNNELIVHEVYMQRRERTLKGQKKGLPREPATHSSSLDSESLQASSI